MKSGFIAIIGPPNAGKSSLTNALVGEKISIVSPKAQTTRDRVMGILTENDYQMVFVDTPGVFKSRNKLGEHMQKSVKSATKDCDAIVIVLDTNKPITLREMDFIAKHLDIAPVFIALNKVDLSNYDKIYPQLSKLSPLLTGKEDGKNIKEIIPISCKTKKNIDILKSFLIECLTDDVQYFDSEDLSDKSLTFMAAEIVREKALWLLQDEIPHGIGVIIQTMTDEGKFMQIEADIICERDSHKEIVIGTDGEMLKAIGTKARVDLEKLLDKKVFLKLFVKVRKNWRNNRNIIGDLGYND